MIASGRRTCVADAVTHNRDIVDELEKAKSHSRVKRMTETKIADRAVLDHVGLFVRNLSASRRLYEPALAALGFEVISTEEDGCAFGRKGADDFGINQCETPTSNAHVAFTAESRAMVDAFYHAAMRAGARSKHAPAEHPEYHLGYYAAFIRDSGREQHRGRPPRPGRKWADHNAEIAA